MQQKVITWKSQIRTPVRFHTAEPAEDHYKLIIRPMIIREAGALHPEPYSEHTLYRNGEMISKTIEVDRLFNLKDFIHE